MSTTREEDPDYLRRKIDQAYEMAGLARMDGDLVDEKKWLAEIARLRALLRNCCLSE